MSGLGLRLLSLLLVLLSFGLALGLGFLLGLSFLLCLCFGLALGFGVALSLSRRLCFTLSLLRSSGLRSHRLGLRLGFGLGLGLGEGSGAGFELTTGRWKLRSTSSEAATAASSLVMEVRSMVSSAVLS